MQQSGAPLEPDELAEKFAGIALAAAVPVMEIYTGAIDMRIKADGSPVTEADEKSEAIIVAALRELLPQVPIVSEEAVSRGVTPAIAEDFILVDPLDGTREFIKKNGDFTLNIALIQKGAPTCGAIFAPTRGRAWFGGESGFTVDAEAGGRLPPRRSWRALKTRRPKMQKLLALVSRSHLDPDAERLLRELDVAETRAFGSSLKFCLIAQGDADVYPRFGPTMEWDVAAGDAVLRSAGGVVLDECGEPMRYGRSERAFRNPGFIAWGRRPGA